MNRRSLQFLHPNSTSSIPYLSVLQQCRSMRVLKQIHAHVIILGLFHYAYVTCRIFSFCAGAEAGDLDYARRLFDQMPLPNVFHWNTMIHCYSRSSEPRKGLLLFTKMRAQGVEPNRHTFPIVANPTFDLHSIYQLHGQILKLGFDCDVYVVSSLITCYSRSGAINHARQVLDASPIKNIPSWTSLISGYCCLGLVDDARRVFDEMPETNDATWSAMISGYVQNECFDEALLLFHQLKFQANVKPNTSVLVSALNACTALVAWEEGRWIDSYIDEVGMEYGLKLGTALVDFYAKCGCVESASRAFSRMPRKDVLAWSAMIAGLALNGHSHLALAVFAKMERSGTKPNEITFIGVLTACNHGGLLGQGWYYFKLMEEVYGMNPWIEHYGCMVDLLARAGHLDDAERLIGSMRVKADSLIWGSLLNGCTIHGHVEMGERVGKRLIELEPEHCGRYVLMANMYASMGRWKGVMGIRKMMKERRVVAVAGCSCIQINGVLHRFRVNDRSHSQSSEVYKMLDQLNMELVL